MFLHCWTLLHLIIMSRKPGACQLSAGVLLSTRCNWRRQLFAPSFQGPASTHASIDSDPPRTHTSCTVTANLYPFSTHDFPPQICPAHLPLVSPPATGSRVFSTSHILQTSHRSLTPWFARPPLIRSCSRRLLAFSRF